METAEGVRPPSRNFNFTDARRPERLAVRVGKRKEWFQLVKGTSRRVIVVDSPDPKLFEQAIFIVKNDAFAGEGVTSQQVLGEACRIAQGYAARQTVRTPFWKRVPWWGWAAAAGVVLAAALRLF